MKYIFKNRQSRLWFIIESVLICGLLCFPGLLPTSTAFAEISEYTLKAVYMFRLRGFIEWPSEAEIQDASKPFVISVIGGNPFGGKLEELVSKRTVFGKRVTVRYISDADEIKKTHILFIGEMKEKEMVKVLSFTRDKPIFTVNDKKDAAEKGVLLNFRIIKNKLHFEINETAAHRSGLVLSSRLLRIAARIVHPVKRQKSDNLK